MSSKIKQYFANKENRIKCGITGGTIALAVIIFVGMVFMEENETQNNSIETVSQTESDTQTEEETGYSFDAGDLYDMRLDAQTIEDYYMKSCGDQFNLYTIDEDGVLWGSGHNEYAQIGLGYADEEFHEQKSKIAEHVVHVDYSQKDFVVYLTEEGKLYGLGNDSTYMLLQHTEMPVEDLAYPTKRYVTSPALLLEDVSYARCGRDDVVALKKDGTVWTWGMIWNYQSTGYCITMPQQILTDVKMITGGWFNHAALKEDGTLWTWGYNFSGNCGTDKATMIETPVQVAEDVQRVWTGLLNYSAKEDDITDMEEFGNDYVDNTIIEKTDGTFYACGMGVGDKSVVLPQYYEVSELDTVCSSEFLPLDWDEEMLNRKQREYIERKESQSEEAVLARKNEALLEEIDKNYDMEKLKRKVPRFSEDDKINETYYNAIKTLDTTGFLPDGRYCFYIEQDGRTDVERFQEQRAQHYSPERVAVADVDGDGTAELLFFIEGTCVRDSAEYVYRYSEEKNAFELEFEYSAGCNYYQNGVIKAKPLYSGFIYQDDFWPYSVFQYDENKNEFVLTASVEEIPKAPENPDNFPEEYDKDGDGKVYIISQGESVKYLDEQEYLAWKKQIFWMPEMKIDWCELGSNKELLEEIDKNYDMEKLKRKVPRFSEDDKINEAYYNAIKTLDTTGFLPDGRYCFGHQKSNVDVERFREDMERAYCPNKVAVADVDGDGTVELLIFTVGFYMADITEYVYRYSEEKNGFELEFAYAGGCDYYEHGVIKASPLHSMYSDYQDGFWPYSVYQYDENKKEFVEKVSVDQITNVPINSDAFPEEYDKDGDGKVYIISQGESVAYMDEKEYLAWEKQVFWMPEMKIDWCELGSNKELLEEIDKNYDMEKLKRKVPRFSEDDKINEAYYNAIKTLDTTGFLPDGRYCFWYYDEPENYLETKEKLGGFGIAVCDVDVDGKKEMLIGLRKELSEPYGVLIYRYNEEQRKFEVENGFSSRINFYNNGYVEEYWTMPNYDQPAFTIYQYNPALDTFEKMFWINGIEDVGIDDYFPTEQDLDGNGKGYIMSVDGKETYVDDAAYQKMMEQYIDLNKRIDVEWVDLFQMEDMVN